jgi:hypothetical protein
LAFASRHQLCLSTNQQQVGEAGLKKFNCQAFTILPLLAVHETSDAHGKLFHDD